MLGIVLVLVLVNNFVAVLPPIRIWQLVEGVVGPHSHGDLVARTQEGEFGGQIEAVRTIP